MGEDTIVLRMESGDDAVLGQRWEHALYIAAGLDPYQLVESAVAGAAALSGSSKPLREKQLPPTLDVFGWCTWDAFYSRVSARGAGLPQHRCGLQRHGAGSHQGSIQQVSLQWCAVTAVLANCTGCKLWSCLQSAAPPSCADADYK